MSSQQSVPTPPPQVVPQPAHQAGPAQAVPTQAANGQPAAQKPAAPAPANPAGGGAASAGGAQAAAGAKAGGPPKRIGDVLLAKGLIDEAKLQRALSESQATKVPIGTCLVKLNYVTDKQLGQALAELHGFEYCDLDKMQPDPEVIKLLPEDFIKRHMVVPIRIDMKYKRVEVVMARPDNLRVLDEIALLTGFRPIARVSTHKEMIGFLDQYFRHHVSGDEALRKIEEEMLADSGSISLTDELEAEMAAEDAPVVLLVNSILTEAIETGASDIHVEPQKERLLIRFRIDGILKEVKSIPKKMASAVTSRMKVASGMDIAERRRPQDGRMKIKLGSVEFDMRVNTLPLQFGEKVCIRILRPMATSGGLAQCGLTEEENNLILRMIKAPNGIVLVTGPTGSGKTTTLYSCLREINTPEINISTVEDPIEYPMTGVNQTPINHKAGMTFASALRALLRQDPDVILVGEIRDEETLESAIHAALTGHLVFSTLHTNSASKTVTRLLEMGAPPYLVSTAVIGILAQRLVRRLCTQCKESYTATPEELAILSMTDAKEPVTLYRGKGCDKCGGSGYSGRVGLYEIMRMNRELREMVEAGASTISIEDTAVKNGMYTLAMDGKRKALTGMTSLAEVTRVLGVDLAS